MNDNTEADDQFVDFTCPYCGQGVSFPMAMAGTVQECVDCMRPVIVPKDGGPGREVPIPIPTKRLALRKFDGKDWKDLLYLFSNNQFSDTAPLVLDGEDDIAKWLERDATVTLTTLETPFTLAIQSRESGKVIGLLTLAYTDADRRQATLYVAVHPDFQSQEFDIEAARAALGFCFKGISLHRVTGQCTSDNAAACRIFEKAGMRREGEFIKNIKIAGKWRNTVTYATLDEEFKAD